MKRKYLIVRLEEVPLDNRRVSEFELASPNWDWKLSEGDEEVAPILAEGKVNCFVHKMESGEWSLFVDLNSLIDSSLISNVDRHPVL